LDQPLEGLAEEGRVAAARPQGVRSHRPLARGIEQHEIGLEPRREASRGQFQDLRGLLAHTPDQLAEIQLSRVHQIGHTGPECGLQADDAERRLVELEFLLRRGVRRVVGRDAVDRAVGQSRGDGGTSSSSRSGGFILYSGE
jgi:hypothetical protein